MVVLLFKNDITNHILNMADEQDNIVKTADGQPVVPTGTQAPMSNAPVDTLPRPTPRVPMPASQSEPQSPSFTNETSQSRAVEGTITFDDLAAKKGFKNPDDLAKAYQNLESQTKRVEATLSDAIRARMESTPEPEDKLPNVNQIETQDDALKIVNNLIRKEVRKTEDKFEYQMYLYSHPDDQKFASEAINIVKENPGIKWETAFKAAKADYLGEHAREEGKQEAYQSMQNKESLQSVHSSQRSSDNVVDHQSLIEGIKTGKIPLSEAKQYINTLSKQVR